MISYLPDWQPRLFIEMAKRRYWPFIWGQHDCCLFAADMFQTTTGVDPVPHLRGKYATALQAKRLLKKVGTPTVESVASEAAVRLGVREVDTGQALLGSIGLVRHNDQDMLAVIIDERVAIPGESQLVFLPRRFLRKAWAV